MYNRKVYKGIIPQLTMVDTDPQQDNIPEWLDQSKESLKLTKNSKGCNWEIKLKDETISTATLDRLELINKHMEDNYGNQD